MPEQAIKDKTAIVGIGWTEFSRDSGVSTMTLAAQAGLKAIDDAGLKPRDVDGVVTWYHGHPDTVHAWDFAQATGQQVAVPDPVTAHVLEAAHKIITPEGRRRVGFDPERPADPDAGVLERLIAFTGRPQHTNPSRTA